MALEFMYKEMLKQFLNNSASNEMIENYQIVWSSAMQNNSKPIPCPTCFMQGNISRLKPLPDKDDFSSARCESCKSKFEWHNPDS